MSILAQRRSSMMRDLFPLIAVSVAIGCVPLVFIDKTSLWVVLVAATVASLSVVSLPPAQLFGFYFVYLSVEGALKIWSGGNALVHVGSDLLLLTVFTKLILRFVRERKRTALPAYSSPATVAAFRPVLLCLIIFWLWVFVQFINPWGLGLLPSLAAMKLYLVPFLPFFAVAFLLKDEEIAWLPALLLTIGILEGSFALWDWMKGPEFLASWNSSYARIAFEFLKGAPYRPFGTTRLPGEPGLWILHTGVAALLVWQGAKDQWSARFKPLALLYFPIGLATLVVCQVRITMIRWIALVALGLLVSSRRSALVFCVLFPLGWATYTALMPPAQKQDYTVHHALHDRMLQVVARVRSLEREKTWSQARGNWAWEEFKRRAAITVQGIGLSRISASSVPWQALIAHDRYFDARWGFTDNLFLALFTELGLGGLSAYALLVLCLIYQLTNRGTYVGRLVAVYCSLMVLSGYASEGILYQPDASAFWFHAALGLRLADPRRKGGIG